jgi:hypothetical protein
MYRLSHPFRHPFCVAIAFLALGCTSQTGSGFADPVAAGGTETALDLAPPSAGFQLESQGVPIEPGDDVRWCEVLRVPGAADDVYRVDRIEGLLSPGARDLIVSIAPLGSETEALMEVGAHVPCTRAGEAFGEDLEELTSTQRTWLDQQYPRGVGVTIHGGQRIAVDYLYVNTGEETSNAKIKLNFHAGRDGAFRRTAHTARFNNLTIYTPPRGRSSHLAECAFPADVWIGELVRRTQQRGTGFSVWISGGDRDGELIWHSTRPDEPNLELAEPIRLQAGEGLRFECDYLNTSDRELRFGVNASDETCALNSLYWQADERSDMGQADCLLFEVESDGVARK